MHLLELNFYVGVCVFTICTILNFCFRNRINSNGWEIDLSKKRKPFVVRLLGFFVFTQIPILRFLFLLVTIIMILFTEEKIKKYIKKAEDKLNE